MGDLGQESRRSSMKRTLSIILFLVIATCAVAFAGEKEELLLKKENLELQTHNIQLSAQLMTKQMADIQAALKTVTEKLQGLEKK
jgi:hypothetical protein